MTYLSNPANTLKKASVSTGPRVACINTFGRMSSGIHQRTRSMFVPSRMAWYPTWPSESGRWELGAHPGAPEGRNNKVPVSCRLHNLSAVGALLSFPGRVAPRLAQERWTA